METLGRSLLVLFLVVPAAAQEGPKSSGMAGGLAEYAAAFLVVGGVKAAVSGDTSDLHLAAEPRFWGELGLWVVVERGAEIGLERMLLTGRFAQLSKSVVPLALAMGAVQVVSGNLSLRDWVLSTVAYAGTSLVVDLVADGLIFPFLFGTGPVGWIALGIYAVAKTVVWLYCGEKAERFLYDLFGGGSIDRLLSAGPRAGVVRSVRAIGVQAVQRP